MAKKTNPAIKPTVAQQEDKPGSIKTPKEKKALSLSDFRIQAVILALVGFFLYCNTFSHEYVFDDVMAIVDNEYVQQGTAGITEIMSTDAYQSYLEHKNGSNQLTGGRYRPLSLVTFAIEQQALGINTEENADAKTAKLKQDMHTRHVVNVLLYMLSLIALLQFLRYVVFPKDPIMAFVAALLFAVNPLHTEVVANVKSRDEILSVLFISLTFIKAFRYKENKKTMDLVLGILCFFLALLSKEYALALIVLLPLSFYIFGKDTAKDSLKAALPYLAPLVVYALLRFNAVTGPAEGADGNVMNNPYLYADAAQKIASKILILLDYLRLMIFPNVLVADYSYNQIPYSNFGNPMVWVSVLVYGALVVAMCMLIAKRHVLGFAIAVYLGYLALVSNFLVDIGATMGERLVYHSSIGFAIAVAYLLYKGFERIKQPVGLAVVMVVIVGLCSFKTIDRNKDWKNADSLFLTDIRKSPKSVLINNNVGSCYMFFAKRATDTKTRNEYFAKAITYFDTAISIFPHYYLSHMNRGLCYYNMGMPIRALPDWDTVRLYSPNQAFLAKYMGIAGQLFFSEGMKYNNAHMPDSAIISFKRSVEANPGVPDGWYKLAETYYIAGKYHEAKEAVQTALKIAPNYADAQSLYALVKDK